MDDLNHRYGPIASAGLAGEGQVWAMKQERRTPGVTTSRADMPEVRA